VARVGLVGFALEFLGRIGLGLVFGCMSPVDMICKYVCVFDAVIERGCDTTKSMQRREAMLGCSVDGTANSDFRSIICYCDTARCNGLSVDALVCKLLDASFSFEIDFSHTCSTTRDIVIFSARCNIYISRLCYDVSVRLSVRLSVTEVHWRIIANLSFKFRSQFTAHCGRGACGREGRDHRREEWRDHLPLC